MLSQNRTDAFMLASSFRSGFINEELVIIEVLIIKRGKTMYFNIPTKVYFGDSVLKNFQNEIVKQGRNALIVTGKSSAIKSGVMDDLLPILNELEIGYTVFNEIMENPDISIVEKGKNVFLKSYGRIHAVQNYKSYGHNHAPRNYDFIIAIGGGSPLDAAKAISIMAANDLSKEDIYNTALHRKAFPIIAIPTTSGTGSEITPYSVLSNEETKVKAGFGNEFMFPKISFLDPKYTVSMSHTVTRDTAIDALSHLLEGLYSNKYNEFLLPFIYSGIKLIYENLSKCLKEPDNLMYRKNLMLASNYGGIVIAHTSTTLQHSIGYPLTTIFGVSHGLANGIVMKQIMDLYEPHIKDRLDALFCFLGIKKTELFDWLDTLEMKFMGVIDECFLNERIPEVMMSRNMTLIPYQVKEYEIIQIYESL